MEMCAGEKSAFESQTALLACDWNRTSGHLRTTTLINGVQIVTYSESRFNGNSGQGFFPTFSNEILLFQRQKPKTGQWFPSDNLRQLLKAFILSPCTMEFIREWKCALEKNLHLNRRQVFLPVIGKEPPGTYAQRL
ncbi:hypothetical protein CDAR_207291 [Caerostris darwini]|uniref:Uncharacterized protein n=1 Tax=Caerostris darwini TaxID=1538125 RepID=A0AAV4MF19_9ARAC|nr:hypothetical protein CDAR_207291 [Caerostris darwini]